MKNNKLSRNAKKAFENFKEELGRDFNMDMNLKNNKTVKKIVDKAEDIFDNVKK